MPEPGKCHSCGAAIVWCRNVNGNLQILDAEPSPTGNIAIKDGVCHVMRGELFEEMIDGPRYLDHHATCPNVAKHRKAKR